MKPELVLAYELVEFITDDLKEQTLYISITYCTAVHKCCSGDFRRQDCFSLAVDGKLEPCW